MREVPACNLIQRVIAIGAAILLIAAAATPAAAQIAFEDVSTAAGFGNCSTETWGAAWGDIDGDSYPDIFVNNHRTRAKLYRNNRDGTFSDVSLQVDLSRTAGWTGGRSDVDKHGNAWGDVDNDGDDDLIITVSSESDRLLINDKGLLSDRTTQYGLDLLHHTATRQNLLLDYNGDGRLDLASVALTRAAYAPQLSNGTFGHGTGFEKPMACSKEGQWAHLMDLRPSAGLELLCAPRTGTYPKVNTFSNGVVGKTAASIQFGAVNDAVTLDYNRDLRPDIFIVRRAERPSGVYQFSSRQFEAQFVTAAYKSNSVKFKSTGVLTLKASLRAGEDPEGDPANIDVGSIKWSPAALTVQLDPRDSRNWGIGSGSAGINVGYLTASGEWQITQSTDQYDYSYVQVASTDPITNLTLSGTNASDTGYRPLLESNTVDGLIDMGKAAGFTVPLPCQSAVAGDFDNDMDEDLFLTCTDGARNLPDRLYMNNGNGTFSKVANAGGAMGPTGAAVADKAGTSDSVVVADYDRDGFLDLFVINGLNMRPVYIGGPKQLFHNVGNGNRWIELDLVGTLSNRDGVGSKVYVTAGGVTQYREQNGGYHRWSQNYKRIHVGLGSNVGADVKVEWPNGATTVYAALESNRLYQLKQDGTATKISRKLP